MRNSDEITLIAESRLEEARILLDNGKCEGAFYLAGYSVELMLKAQVCKHLQIPSLFDGRNCEVEGIADIKRAVQTHQLKPLLILSGLFQKFNNDKAGNLILAETYALLDGWNETVRYRAINSQSKKTVEELIQLLEIDKEGKNKGLLVWVKSQ